MAVETVVYPQEDKERGVVGVLDKYMDHPMDANWDTHSTSSIMHYTNNEWDIPNSPPDLSMEAPKAARRIRRRLRRRTKSCKNKEELEKQRMIHIAVERNRRKQMNDYLTVIRSLMPPSYAQRGDQASIIGGAINFVKELEQLVQNLEAHKRMSNHQQLDNFDGFSPLFADFFTFPQYSTESKNSTATSSESAGLADIQVSMVENHANLNILSKKRHRQLLKMVVGIQCLSLTILHLNVTSVDRMVLYSLSVKVEDGCRLTTVDEIAEAVYHVLAGIEEDDVLIHQLKH